MEKVSKRGARCSIPATVEKEKEKEKERREDFSPPSCILFSPSMLANPLDIERE
jgi:hypothetical protein